MREVSLFRRFSISSVNPLICATCPISRWVWVRLRQDEVGEVIAIDLPIGLAAEYDSYSYRLEESADNQQIFYYGAATTEGPLTLNFDITLSYVFTMDGWTLTEMNAEETYLSASGRSLLDPMLSNAWDTSVQITEYVLFFKDGQGVRLNGAIS